MNIIREVINRMSEIFDIGLWLQWLAQLDRTFVFLLALPFVVAVVGLWAAYRERDWDEAQSRPAARSRAADKGAADSRHRNPHQFGGKPHGNLME